MTTPAEDPRTALRARKLEHLDRLIAEIDSDLAKVPRLWWLNLFAIPAGFFKGFFAFGAVVVCASSLVGVVLYILTVRRREYDLERVDLHRENARASAVPKAP